MVRYMPGSCHIPSFQQEYLHTGSQIERHRERKRDRDRGREDLRRVRHKKIKRYTLVLIRIFQTDRI